MYSGFLVDASQEVGVVVFLVDEMEGCWLR